MQAKAIISLIHNHTVFIKREAKENQKQPASLSLSTKQLAFLFYLYVN